MNRPRYEVELTSSAARALRKLDRPVQVRIARAIDSLAIDPRPNGTIKLSAEDDIYRIRSGDYRIIYSIADRRLTVLVIGIGHRRDIYRK